MKQNECKGYEEWMSYHITEHELPLPNEDHMELLYACWDETGAYPIRISSSLQEVVTTLKGYAESL